MALCRCRMSHVLAVQWLCDNVDDECRDADSDVDDDIDVTLAVKLSPPTPVVTAADSPLAVVCSASCQSFQEHIIVFTLMNDLCRFWDSK